jgi:hypothetical protein
MFLYLFYKHLAMKQLTLLLASCMILVCCNYTAGSGNIITEKRMIENFTGIAASNAINVEVKIGPIATVAVEADDNIIKHIITKVSGNVLKISIDNLHNIGDAHLKVYVTVPVVESIGASSSAGVKVLGVIKENGKLSFTASSSADIEAEVDAPEVNAEANSSGSVTLSGRTKNYKAEASSSGNIKSAGLLSENTTVLASSSGNANVHASVNLNADASSSGSIVYHGGASVKKELNSGGSVEKRD